MRDFELAMKAVSDPTRTRILKLLEGGSLCVCQVQAVLGLAASTVSRHLTILRVAGLVEDRRSGKWIECALADSPRNPHARAVLALVRGALARDPEVAADRRRLRVVRSVPLTEICALAHAKTPARAVSALRRGGRGSRAAAQSRRGRGR